MLGAGSFGVVHRAVERATGREYAVKTISKIPRRQRASTAYHLLKIRSEVESMMQLGASLDAVYLKVRACKHTLTNTKAKKQMSHCML
jgi:serine/threonine protein kinase